MDIPSAVLEATHETLEKHGKSLVMVLKYIDKDTVALGTGFIVGSTDSFAHVMTCYHCVESSDAINVRMAGSSEEYQAHIVRYNEDKDIAILRVETHERFPALRFRDFSLDIPIGEWVYLVGYYNPNKIRGISPALRLNPAVLPGRINGVSNGSISHSCRSQGGCSGAPLMYMGKVIGVLFQTQVQMEHAVSAETINSVMKQWLRLPTSANRTTEEMINLI